MTPPPTISVVEISGAVIAILLTVHHLFNVAFPGNMELSLSRLAVSNFKGRTGQSCAYFWGIRAVKGFSVPKSQEEYVCPLQG